LLVVKKLVFEVKNSFRFKEVIYLEKGGAQKKDIGLSAVLLMKRT